MEFQTVLLLCRSMRVLKDHQMVEETSPQTEHAHRGLQAHTELVDYRWSNRVLRHINGPRDPIPVPRHKDPRAMDEDPARINIESRDTQE